MEIKSDGIMAKYISDDAGRVTSAAIDRMTGGRLRWYTPLEGLTLGSTFLQLQMIIHLEAPLAPVYIDIDIPKMQFLYLSADYDIGDWTLAAEYHRCPRSPPGPP